MPGARARYGYHQQTRKRVAQIVAAGITPCSRFGELIDQANAWDLDHADGGGYAGPAHAYCNRAAGGRASTRKLYEDDPERAIYWGPPPEDHGLPRSWSRPWFDWRNRPT